ncbi:hypothetical protein [Hanstruepera marina]|uniref:hypothetical protein n=1 Tax=Hanstruepera marina TaxID=2873265 RepID=UPI001CA6F2B5|nr:hypothetical protein [Hanstruepera marina]
MNAYKKDVLVILMLSLCITIIITFALYQAGIAQKEILKEDHLSVIINKKEHKEINGKSKYNNSINSQKSHLIYEVKRSYFGAVSKLYDIEMWSSKSKLLISKGKTTTLFLLKEKKRIVFSEDKKKYVELPLSINKDFLNTSIHKARGYRPTYHWEDIKTLGDSINAGNKYQKITTKGIAKYSEIDLKALVLKLKATDSNSFPKNLTSLIFLDDRNLNQLLRDELFTNSIFYQLKQTIIPPNPVPESYWIEFKLIKFETKKVSEDLFRIPATAIKVNTIEEL